MAAAQIKPILNLDSKVYSHVDILMLYSLAYVSQITQMRRSNLHKKKLHVGRHIIEIRITIEIMTVLVESNNFSDRGLYFSKYDGQIETHCV